MQAEDRWAMAVRVLGVLTFVLVVLAVLEGATVRRARAELQQLRTEKETMKAGVVEAWARQSADEFSEALRRLDELVENPEGGPAAPGGLCAGGRVNRDAITTYAIGQYLSARAGGQSFDAAANTMKTAFLKQYRK